MKNRARSIGPLLAALVLVVASCQTYTVVTEAPVEFWITAEELLEALALDVWSIVKLFF